MIVLEISLLSELKYDVFNRNGQKNWRVKQEICWLCFGLRRNDKVMDDKARKDQCGLVDGKIVQNQNYPKTEQVILG